MIGFRIGGCPNVMGRSSSLVASPYGAQAGPEAAARSDAVKGAVSTRRLAGGGFLIHGHFKEVASHETSPRPKPNAPYRDWLCKSHRVSVLTIASDLHRLTRHFHYEFVLTIWLQHEGNSTIHVMVVEIFVAAAKANLLEKEALTGKHQVQVLSRVLGNIPSKDDASVNRILR